MVSDIALIDEETASIMLEATELNVDVIVSAIPEITEEIDCIAEFKASRIADVIPEIAEVIVSMNDEIVAPSV